MLLPETSLDVGAELANLFRADLVAQNVIHSGSEFGTVTASVGVASMAGGNAFLNPTELVDQADALLYLAKRHGRNRTDVAFRSDEALQNSHSG